VLIPDIPIEEAASVDGLVPLSAEEEARAGTYRLLALLLSKPPDKQTIDLIVNLPSGENPIGKSVAELVKLSKQIDPETIEREFQKLFIGLGEGELVPYGSYYLSGFLHERPLARLRADLRRLGIERNTSYAEPEDGMASLCEIMSCMINGDFGAPEDLSAQSKFFKQHIGSWGPQFFSDLESAPSAFFYQPVASIGQIFFQIETEAFSINH